jgi:hypothetical protein
MVTAKIVCTTKSEMGEGDSRQTSMSFGPDYADGRNKEWAAATPALSLSMTVKGDVGDRFEQGKAYTLTFTDEAEELNAESERYEARERADS